MPLLGEKDFNGGLYGLSPTISNIEHAIAVYYQKGNLRCTIYIFALYLQPQTLLVLLPIWILKLKRGRELGNQVVYLLVVGLDLHIVFEVKFIRE
jgi:hypothetical protein